MISCKLFQTFFQGVTGVLTGNATDIDDPSRATIRPRTEIVIKASQSRVPGRKLLWSSRFTESDWVEGELFWVLQTSLQGILWLDLSRGVEFISVIAVVELTELGGGELTI